MVFPQDHLSWELEEHEGPKGRILVYLVIQGFSSYTGIQWVGIPSASSTLLAYLPVEPTNPESITRSRPGESIDAFSAVLSTEGRVVGPCWEISNLKDLKVTKD